MERKSAFSRTLEYFQTADYREAKACHEAAYNIVAEREPKVAAPKPKPRRAKVNGSDTEETHESLANA